MKQMLTFFRLLCDTDTRLQTVEQIMAHPFFDGFNFRELATSTPPFVPKLENDYDLKYFDHVVIEDSDDFKFLNNLHQMVNVSASESSEESSEEPSTPHSIFVTNVILHTRNGKYN